jgi:N-acetylneuraminic acid mutarotase
MKSLRYVWQKVAVNSELTPRSSHAISAIGDRAYLIGGEHIARTPIDSTVYEYTSSRDSWEPVEVKGGLPPEHRIAHGQAVIGKKIYVFGGRQGIHMSEKPLNDLHSFDTATGVWEGPIACADGEPPAPRSFHKMTSVGDILYVFGGCAAAGRQKDLYSFNTTTRVWTALKTSTEIAGRGGPSFAAVCTQGAADASHKPQCDALMVTAGFSGQENNDMHLYDIASDSWSPSVTLPYRARSVCPTTTVTAGRYVILFGGEVNTSDRGHEGAGDFASDLVCIDSVTGRVVECVNVTEGEHLSPPARGWTEMATLAASGSDETSYSVILCGGLTGNDENPQRLNDTWLLTLLPEQ